MKFVSYRNDGGEVRAGLSVDGTILDLAASVGMSPDPLKLLEDWEGTQAKAMRLQRAFRTEGFGVRVTPERLLAPVPFPASCRDGYAFRQHVEAARRNRGVEMIPEFDEFPVFYFTNHRGVVGEGPLAVEADQLEQLDFELEAAIVIGKGGKNIPVEEAERHIAGLMVMNDFSARALQSEEMRLNLGPAKGKDFATALGPYLVTLDELESKRLASPSGSRWDLRMTARHNGKLVSDGNVKDMAWTFAQLVERASYGVELFPGDVIGSGTVGTGCYLELNGTWTREAKAAGRTHAPVWLMPGDAIELEIEGLGLLRNTIERAAPTRRLSHRAKR